MALLLLVVVLLLVVLLLPELNGAILRWPLSWHIAPRAYLEFVQICAESERDAIKKVKL